MTLIVRPDKRQYQLLDFLFEFKYISLKDNKLNLEFYYCNRNELASSANLLVDVL